jgi:hypothetical protein
MFLPQNDLEQPIPSAEDHQEHTYYQNLVLSICCNKTECILWIPWNIKIKRYQEVLAIGFGLMLSFGEELKKGDFFPN